MKTMCFFLSLFMFLIIPSFVSIGQTTIKPSAIKVWKLYTPDVNPQSFERFIIFENPYSKRIYKHKSRIAKVIFHFAHKYEIDPISILAILHTESRFNYRAIGPVKEKGIGQINDVVWLSEANRDNLYNAGIIKKGQEGRLRWIGVGVESTAYILDLYRSKCFKFHEQGILKSKGYKTITECYIRKYNSSNNNREYYVKVTSAIGKYYYFIRSRRDVLKRLK